MAEDYANDAMNDIEINVHDAAVAQATGEEGLPEGRESQLKAIRDVTRVALMRCTENQAYMPPNHQASGPDQHLANG